MKEEKYTHFLNEIDNPHANGQSNFGTFLWQMGIALAVIIIGLIFFY